MIPLSQAPGQIKVVSFDRKRSFSCGIHRTNAFERERQREKKEGVSNPIARDLDMAFPCCPTTANLFAEKRVVGVAFIAIGWCWGEESSVIDPKRLCGLINQSPGAFAHTSKAAI